MKRKTIEIVLVSFAIFHLQSHFLGASENCEDFPCCESPIIVGQPLDSSCINPGYPYPAAFKSCNSWDIYVKGEFLYWSLQPLTLQLSAQKISFDGQTLDSYVQGAPYHPGFRVSLGLDLDSVILDFTFTRVHSKKTERFQAGPNDGFRPVFAPPSIQNTPILFSRLEATLFKDLDIGIISLQKPVYLGKKIIMSLNYGLAALWFGQKWEFTGTALPFQSPDFFTDNGTVFANHKAWYVGPNLSVRANALLPWGFKAIASLDLFLLYGALYKGIQTSSFLNVPDIIDNTTVKTKGSVPISGASHGGAVGLGWGRYFWCDRYYIDLSVSYILDYHHIFVGGVVFSPVASDFLTLDSFSVHGLAVGGSLDF